MSGAVAVYGAYGHTGRFVVAELARRRMTPVLSGRDEDKVNELAAEYPHAAVRPAGVDDHAALDRALAGVAAVINCAGPFATTATPVIGAALRAGIPYVDVAAEIEANVDTFARHDAEARERGVAIVPAMAFYGGLGDLLATAALVDWKAADEISIAYGLSGWAPTAGTMAAGRVSRERRGGLRVRHADGRLQLTDEAPPPASEWTFPAPLGRQAVVGEFTMADTVTIARHVDVPRIQSFMTAAAVSGVASGPAADGRRPPEHFVVQVVARKDGVERRATASGHDIYATTAPLAVEAVTRLLASAERKSGAYTAGQAFDARDFLAALSPEHLTVAYE